ncbi:MAG: cell division protein FtsQ/DivIB [Oscillospiraceae bacterium]
MARYDRYGAARKKKRHSLFAPISVLLVGVAIVFGMGVFFRVQEIEVVGSVSYTDEEVIEASGIDVGDNLFFINRISASSRIFARLPLVEEASIERELPNKIIITVDESFAMAYVNWEGQYWMMTGNCKLLGSGSVTEVAGLIRVLNVTPVEPKAGEIMQVDASESLKLSYLQTLLHAMQLMGMTDDVKDIDMTNPADPTFRYLDRFTVKMGPNENVDYKLRMLLSAVEQMESDMTGTVDLAEGTAVHVSPD